MLGKREVSSIKKLRMGLERTKSLMVLWEDDKVNLSKGGGCNEA